MRWQSAQREDIKRNIRTHTHQPVYDFNSLECTAARCCECNAIESKKARGFVYTTTRIRYYYFIVRQCCVLKNTFIRICICYILYMGGKYIYGYGYARCSVVQWLVWSGCWALGCLCWLRIVMRTNAINSNIQMLWNIWINYTGVQNDMEQVKLGQITNWGIRNILAPISTL